MDTPSLLRWTEAAGSWGSIFLVSRLHPTITAVRRMGLDSFVPGQLPRLALGSRRNVWSLVSDWKPSCTGDELRSSRDHGYVYYCTYNAVHKWGGAHPCRPQSRSGHHPECPSLRRKRPCQRRSLRRSRKPFAAKGIVRPAASKQPLRLFNNLHEGSTTYVKQTESAGWKPLLKKQGLLAEAPWRQAMKL